MLPEHLKQFEEPIKVLDHGFVRLVDTMGDDSAIVQAARVSYGPGTKTISDDRGLIRRLMRDRHTSPIEMCEIKFHCKMPIFVARQWVRHRTASLNEISGRYSVLKSEAYVPEPERIQRQSLTNKQGSGEGFPERLQNAHTAYFKRESSEAFDHYTERTDGDMARELARINLPVSTYTEWYWKIDLHNLLHFLALRLSPHAQYEIQVYGEAIAEIVKVWCPLVWEAFEDYRLKAHTFSRMEMELMIWLLGSRRFDSRLPTPEERRSLADMYELGSNRERAAFWRKVGLL